MARAQIGDNRRKQILAACETCVVREGLAKTTLQKIADEADLPRSLVRYFIGNKGDIIPLLIDRMMARADHDYAQVRAKTGSLTTQDAIDFLFDTAFSNEVTNTIVAELWKLGECDESVRLRLAEMYRKMQQALADQMAADGMGGDGSERMSAAHALICLAYGSASFASLYKCRDEMKSSKQAAQALVTGMMTQKEKTA